MRKRLRPDPLQFKRLWSVPSQLVAAQVLDQARPGSIIVMHINHQGFHTADALPEIIDSLSRRGMVFVTVSEMLSSR